MKILYIATRWPMPPVTGDRLRSLYFLRELTKRYDVTLLALCPSRAEEQMLANSVPRLKLVPVPYKEIGGYFRTMRAFLTGRPLQVEYYNMRRLKKAIFEELSRERYDLIIACMVRAAHLVEEIDSVPKVVDLIDALSLNYTRFLADPHVSRLSPSYWIYRVEKNRVFEYEKQVIGNFDRVLLVSEVDKQHLVGNSDTDRVMIVPNGVNLFYFRFSVNGYRPNRIIFHGNIHYYPNTDAVLYFYSDVFPRVKSQVPDAVFYVVGNRPRKAIRALADRGGVVVTGKVNDVRSYLWDSAVSVAPLRVGAGIQNKILEAMAAGVPVVTTPVGLEGIHALPGEHLLVASSSEEFADHVIRLMQDYSFRQRITHNARRLIEEKYRWEHTLQPLFEWIESVR